MNLRQYTKEFRYNIHLAAPIILAMLGHTLVGFVDNVMVGRIGPTELAAVSLGNSIIFLAMSFGIGFSTAVTALTAEAHGRQNFHAGKSVLKHGILLCTTLSVLMLIILLFAKEIMVATKQDPQVIALAKPYVDLVAVSLIPLMIFQAFKQFSDGFSLTRYSMYVTFCGNAVNVVLNFLFIYGMFGLPRLGVLGAGIGTLASRFIMPILLWYILTQDSRTRDYVTAFRWKLIEWAPIRKLITQGVPSSLQMVFEAGLFIAATWISGSLGKNYQASHQIALSLSSMTFMISAGMSVVAMIRVSNFKGKEDWLNLKRVAISIFLFVGLCQVALALFFVLFRHWLPDLFLDTSDMQNAQDIAFVIANATQLLLIAGIFQIPDGIQITALGALRGLQDVKVPMIITFVAYWLIAFPISFYLGLFTPMKNLGIWTGLMIGLTCSAVLLLWRFLHSTKGISHSNTPSSPSLS